MYKQIPDLTVKDTMAESDSYPSVLQSLPLDADRWQYLTMPRNETLLVVSRVARPHSYSRTPGYWALEDLNNAKQLRHPHRQYSNMNV